MLFANCMLVLFSCCWLMYDSLSLAGSKQSSSESHSCNAGLNIAWYYMFSSSYTFELRGLNVLLRVMIVCAYNFKRLCYECMIVMSILNNLAS
ncbi:hypothetical protein HanIR_Chr13g0623061 [Helianthus annuus]|nr:hypothetical protein HanIR_Chr13g0623061 [Helianthus annuus]